MFVFLANLHLNELNFTHTSPIFGHRFEFLYICTYLLQKLVILGKGTEVPRLSFVGKIGVDENKNYTF